MRHVMGKFQEAVTKLPTEWRVRALAALAHIIHLSVRIVDTMNNVRHTYVYNSNAANQ